jgi:hypothetical protein
MKCFFLVLLVGCATDLEAGAGPEESEEIAAVTCDPSAGWCKETAPVSATLLHGVWAASATDVFAVGDNGTILRRVSGTWTQMTSPTTNHLRGVYGLSSSDVWASGVAVNNVGTLLHWDGTAWSLVSGATTDIDSVWASSSTDVWFTGSTVVLHWNGSAVSTVQTSFTGALLSVSGTGPSDVYVAGESANVHHWNGSSWTNLPAVSGVTEYLSVLAVAAGDAWASDPFFGKEAAHWSGGNWTVMRAGTGGWNGMSALSSTDIWGAGGSHTGHWNGTAWTIESPALGSSVILMAVTTRPGNAWVVGDSSVIGHRTF